MPPHILAGKYLYITPSPGHRKFRAGHTGQQHFRKSLYLVSVILNTIIVDDEESGANVLRLLCESYFPQIHVQKVCLDILSAEEAIRSLKPDLVFLDIQMPGGTGFDLLEKIENIDFAIIFVTAYDHYALRALKRSAADYLLKPVSKNDLAQAIQKGEQMLKLIRSALPGMQNDLLLQRKINTETLIINKYKKEFIDFKDIICVEADSNYSIVHGTQNRKFVISKTLKEIDELLCDEQHDFLRIHKSFIINTHQIISQKNVNESFSITLSNQMTVEVSKRKKTEIRYILSAAR